jgi:hypothetical protein
MENQQAVASQAHPCMINHMSPGSSWESQFMNWHINSMRFEYANMPPTLRVTSGLYEECWTSLEMHLCLECFQMTQGSQPIFIVYVAT